VSREEEIGRRLVAHLRATLGAPGLDLAEPPAPLTGGFDTEIFALRLREAPPAWPGALVLRLLRPHHDPAIVLREQATQNTVADQGYPAPRVRLASTDATHLGAPFVLMDCLPGIPLVDAGLLGMERALLDAQLRLHRLDPAPLTRVLGDAVSFDAYLAQMERHAEQGALDGLRGALRWLGARRPPPAPVAICHGDLHPRNILVEEGRVTGVLDWPNVLVADPAFDLAATWSILRFVPAALTGMPAARRWLARLVQPALAARYRALYRRRRPIDRARLRYYEVAAALRALVRVGQSRQGRAGAPPPGPLDRSPYADRLAGHVASVTGVTVTLPPVPAPPACSG
jgi:aminoglycoside phosphotransferase (APT) family kinase protein